MRLFTSQKNHNLNDSPRGWLRRFEAGARELGVAFAALVAELGGEAIRPSAGAGRFAVAAIPAAFDAACALPGWLELGL